MKRYENITRVRFLELGNKYAKWFQDGTLTEKMISEFGAVRECLCECYKILTNSKELARIEKLDLDEKNVLWDECKKFCESLPGPERIKFVKAYWALGCLMQKTNV
jgi:hypothetical protein